MTAPSRREEIIAAAAELFARHGFHGVGIDDIGAAVGVSGPALYRHFSSKDAILGEMLTSISKSLLEGGSGRLAAAEDPADALRELVAFHTDFALSHPALITVQERDLGNLRDADRREVRTLQRRYVEVWVQAIQAAHHGVTEERARACAHAVFGLINSTPHSRYLGRPELTDLLAVLALGALDAVGVS
ncbi:MAG: SACE_7040 family transcriptional regulator [Thermocrispum sp.]